MLTNFMRLTTLALLISTWSLQAQDLAEYVKKHSTQKQYCQFQTLKELGWQFSSNISASSEAKTGKPCQKGTLAEAQKQGDLQVSLKMDFSSANSDSNQRALGSLHSSLEQLLYGEGSLCGYKFKVGDAAVEATEKLAKNVNEGNYQFGIGQDSFCEVEGDDWKPVKPFFDFLNPQKFHDCLQAKNSPEAAIQCFYNKKCLGECAVGLQVAELATQQALYRGKMDAAFSKGEMSIGEWSHLAEKTENPFHSQKAKEQASLDKYAVEMSKKGAQYLVGVSGYIGNVFGEKFLDSTNDRGENYMIVSVSAEANQQLVNDGGLMKINELNRKIWDKYQIYLNDKTLSDDQQDQLHEEIREMLNSNPIYTGINVFVHPLGNMTFGKHIARLLGLNSRTPYTIQLYPENINGPLFKRYVDHRVNDCLKSQR